MKRAVEVEVEAVADARATLRDAIVENPRAVWEQRRLERTVIIIALVRNCIIVGRIENVFSINYIMKWNGEATSNW